MRLSQFMPFGPCITKSHVPPTRMSIDCVVIVNPRGPHQLPMFFGSVNAPNTSSRGASMTRVRTSSRSAVSVAAGLTLLSDMVLLLRRWMSRALGGGRGLLLHVAEIGLEVVEALLPVLSVLLEPRRGFREWLRFETA